MSEVKINKVSAAIGSVPYTTTIQTANHVIYSDEPLDHHGADKGPKASDLLISSLAACTCITVKMYAGRKEWDLKGVTVNATMERVTESGEQTTTAFLEVAFEGNLDEDQIKRLLVIAGKCPIHKTLAPAMKIEIRLKG